MPAPDPSYRGWQRFLDRAVLWSCSLLIEAAVFALSVFRGNKATRP